MFLGGLGLIACLFIANSDSYFKVSLGLLLGGVVELIAFLFENRKEWQILRTVILHPNKPIRITAAYLFRIELNGKYLLIKRHKKDMAGYQPVGGAYKYLKEENQVLFNDLGIEPCNRVPRDEDTEHDLRIILEKRKKLLKYLKWFSSRKNREIDPIREFYEELIEPGHLKEIDFRHFKYLFSRKHWEFAIPSPVFEVDEFRYADIYELRLENDYQKAAIHALQKGSDEIIFATPEEIRKGRTVDGKVILPHSFKILPI